MNNIQWYIFGFNTLLLFLFIPGMRVLEKKHGKLTEKQAIFIVLGFFSYFFISPLAPLLLSDSGIIVLMIVIVAVWWGIGYPIFRWIYRNINKSK
jgi:hypothetical protein